jgi:hypothetical protein
VKRLARITKKDNMNAFLGVLKNIVNKIKRRMGIQTPPNPFGIEV